ncbi:MAG TPA: ABC transporter permease [Blastocatellia bacterium]|jgi:peptide/nickel transport system permease protein|nr:ABC transporter permease [Blastocatellia bacterium]
MTNRPTSEEGKEVIAERGPGEAVVEPLTPPDASRAGVTEPGGIEAARGRSPSQILWLKLRRNRTAMFGLYTLIVLYAAAILAGFLAPYKYDDAVHELPFYPPMLARIHLFDEQGNLRWPFVYGITPVPFEHAKYQEDVSKKYPIRFFVRGASYHVLWVVRSNVHLFGVDEPGHIFLFGSDYVGQDIFSRILYGAQISLSISILGIIISTTIGVIIGGVAGYFGGATDFLLMRTVEVMLAIPSLYFILIMRQMFGSGLSGTQIYVIIVVILAFIGWATEARVIRGMVLSLKEQEYVIAARALGYNNARVIVRHILPNTLSFVIVTATLSVPFYILGEVALSFLGVGIQEPEASWGNMLTAAQNNQYLTNYPWMLIPGVFIFMAVMAWNFLGDGLRDAADPRTLG